MGYKKIYVKMSNNFVKLFNLFKDYRQPVWISSFSSILNNEIAIQGKSRSIIQGCSKLKWLMQLWQSIKEYV